MSEADPFAGMESVAVSYVEQPVPVPAYARPASEWEGDPPLCTARCMKLAALTIDGEPFCVDCADKWLDRIQAVSIAPAIEEKLPPLFRQGRLIIPRMPDPEPDMTKLNELRRQWVAYQLHVEELQRCIALTPIGQCVRRRMFGQRLCETHFAARYGSGSAAA